MRVRTAFNSSVVAVLAAASFGAAAVAASTWVPALRAASGPRSGPLTWVAGYRSLSGKQTVMSWRGRAAYSSGQPGGVTEDGAVMFKGPRSAESATFAQTGTSGTAVVRETLGALGSRVFHYRWARGRITATPGPSGKKSGLALVFSGSNASGSVSFHTVGLSCGKGCTSSMSATFKVHMSTAGEAATSCTGPAGRRCSQWLTYKGPEMPPAMLSLGATLVAAVAAAIALGG